MFGVCTQCLHHWIRPGTGSWSDTAPNLANHFFRGADIDFVMCCRLSHPANFASCQRLVRIGLHVRRIPDCSGVQIGASSEGCLAVLWLEMRKIYDSGDIACSSNHFFAVSGFQQAGGKLRGVLVRRRCQGRSGIALYKVLQKQWAPIKRNSGPSPIPVCPARLPPPNVAPPRRSWHGRRSKWQANRDFRRLNERGSSMRPSRSGKRAV